MEKWSLAGEKKSKAEPICSISEIQSFCCIPKIANKSLLSFWDGQMCFISSFTSERVDLPGDEREESVAMAEGYNYIKTLPSKQWVITLPRTLRGPAPAARHPAEFYRILQDSTGFYLLPRAGTAPSSPFLTNRTPPHASGCLSCAASLGSHSGAMTSHRKTQAASGNAQWPIQSPSWWFLWKIPPFQRTGPGFEPPEQPLKGQKWVPSHEQNKSYLARERIKQTPVYNQ